MQEKTEPTDLRSQRLWKPTGLLQKHFYPGCKLFNTSSMAQCYL